MSDAAIDLLVVRHGQSEWNALGRSHGWADPPLSALGEAQAVAAAEPVARERVEPGVFSSDSRRARRTAELLAERAGLDSVSVTADLREHHIGEWDGKTWEQIEQTWPGARSAWIAEEVHQPPGGEHREEFHARVRRGIDWVAAHGGRRVLVVAHGGVVRALERMSGIDPTPVAFVSGRWFRRENGTLSAGPVFLPERRQGEDL